jgi:hypothetical protein
VLVLPVEEAKPGMTLVMSVAHPEQPDQDLLKPGFTLDEPVLARLRDMGVPFVYVDYPDLAELDRHLLPHLSPARQMVYAHIKNTIAAVQKTARPTVTFPDYYVAMRELVLTLMQQGQHPLYMDVLSGRLGADEVSHATAVAQLAVTLGIRMEQYLIQQRSRLPARHAREVVNLGVAGMLHDIGKAKLPTHLRHYTEIHPPEKDGDLKEWQTHAKIGYAMICRGVEPSAAATVHQHHQHFDGSGFPELPRRNHATALMSGERIHVFARILLAADLYDRLTVAADGRRRPPIEILHLFQTHYSPWIDPRIMKIMPAVIPPFPPGSRLTLSDDSLAVVTAADPEDPYRPVVKRLADDHWTLKGQAIRLAEDDSLSIRALEGLKVEHMMPQRQTARKTARGQADASSNAAIVAVSEP